MEPLLTELPKTEPPKTGDLSTETKVHKPRFQVIKLEESINQGNVAPNPTKGHGHTCNCCRCGR